MEGRVRAAVSPGTRRAGSSSPAWAARRSAARWRARCSATTRRGRSSPSRDYGLPAWTTPDTTVLCASYSGNTEETLACYEAAGALGARRVVVTSGGQLAELARADGVPVIPVAGGFQPRAAVAYMTVAALEVAALCGAGPRMGSEIDVAADHLEQLVVEWGPDGAEDSRVQDARPRARRQRPGDRRRRADAADRLPLEDARSTRTRRSRRSRTSCPSSTTTRSSAGRARRRSGASRGLPRRRRHAPARAGADRADARARRRAGDGHVRRRDARRHGRRARLLARAARRPRVALPRRAARRRPDAGRRHRGAQGPPGVRR